MVESVKPSKTVFTISQYLDWQRSKTLNLSPLFQRRPVWKAAAKSLLIDSVARGFPIPVILLRQVQDLDDLSIKMVVIDGQQRLRTLLSYIDSNSLGDYDEEQDYFTVRRIHNAELSGKAFTSLSTDVKQHILSYELSTHVFPPTTSDALVFQMFARLNSTGLSLTKQEVRNAEFHGNLKSLVYDLSFVYFDQWRKWKVFTNTALARMEEAEAVSELLMAMMNGISAKSQPAISKFYEKHDDELPRESTIRRRFDTTIRAIDEHLSDEIPGSAFQRPTLFFSLFVALYHHMYGLGSPLDSSRPKKLPSTLSKRVGRASLRIRSKDLPERVQDAMDKATGDRTRRMERHRFLMEALNLEPAV